jgi:6-phosphogluconolactonase
MMKPSEGVLEVLDDREAMARRTAIWLTEIALEQEGPLAIALSGGSTPRRLYELMAQSPYREQFPWTRAHWFWGDERFVPPHDARSNFRMAKEAMLSLAPAPAQNIHPMRTQGLSPAEAAALYERELKSYYGAERLDPLRPLFAATILGLGADGHTASLFPGSPALSERERWVVDVTGVATEPRITLTYPALESSRHLAFLAVGREKASAFARLRRDDERLPAARLRPVGEFWLFADAEAVGETG